MKKKDLILILGVIAIVVVAFFAVSAPEAKEVELPLTLSGEDVGLIQVDYNTYQEKIDNEENFIIIIERTGCSYCEMYLPIVETASANLSIPVYYIDTADLSEEEFTKLGSSNTYLKRNKWGTPTTLIMSGNIVVGSLSGYVEEEKFIEFINEYIVIKETTSEE